MKHVLRYLLWKLVLGSWHWLLSLKNLQITTIKFIPTAKWWTKRLARERICDGPLIFLDFIKHLNRFLHYSSLEAKTPNGGTFTNYLSNRDSFTIIYLEGLFFYYKEPPRQASPLCMQHVAQQVAPLARARLVAPRGLAPLVAPCCWRYC